MALEAVVYPQGPFSYNYRESYSLGGAGGRGAASWGSNSQEDDKALHGILEINNQNYHQLDQRTGGGLSANWDYSSSSPNSAMQQVQDQQYWDPNISSPDEAHSTLDHHHSFPGMVLPTPVMDLEPPEGVAARAASGAAVVGRRKRRRTKSTKNKEEIENQRMTHIAVERNRRKQMNEYLAVLRSLMPTSYVQRGDQASIIGGAINFVKELEQLLQNMEAHKKSKEQKQDLRKPNGLLTSSPFAEFFTFPQYSSRAPQSLAAADEAENKRAALADIEVTMVESHANLKILSKKRCRQLLKMVAGLQSLRLSVLHLNATTVDQIVLYSISVKVEEGCHLNTADEIAAAVNQMIHRIEEEAAFS